MSGRIIRTRSLPAAVSDVQLRSIPSYSPTPSRSGAASSASSRWGSPASTWRARGAPRGLAPGGLSGRDGLHGRPRQQALAAGRTGARYAASHLVAHGLPARRHPHEPAAGRPGKSLCVALCPWPGLPQADPQRLQQLAERIQQVVGPFGFRAFVDSAPVLERPPASRPGLAGSARTPCYSTARPAAGSFSASYSSTSRCRSTSRRPAITAAAAACLDICPPRRSSVNGCWTRGAAFPTSPSSSRADPGRAARQDRQPRIRLRRLPDRLPLEPLRTPHRAERLSAAP